MNSEVLNAAYHCTDNYIDITATSILTLFEQNKSFSEINIYIIENGFTEATKKKCSELAERYNRKIFFVPIGDFLERNGLEIVQIKKKWLLDSYSRLFLDEFLPADADRVLYLDGDILIMQDLHELWNIDLEDNYCAAVPDCLSDEYNKLFGMKKGSAYCNSGVILIDLNKWRENQVDNLVKNYVREHSGYIFFMEQTVLNVLLQGKIKHLDAKYNVTTTMQYLNYDEILTIRKPAKFFTRQEVSEALRNPAIIHMTSLFFVINRAWNEKTNHPEHERFNYYHDKLGWGKFAMQKDNRGIKTRIIDFGVHALPRKLTVWIVSFLYNYARIWKIKLQARKNKHS